MFSGATSFLGVGWAILSALVWGSGDFTGGFASRRCSSYQTLFLSALSGLAVLAVAAVFIAEGFPSPLGILWAALGGACGALGIAALYRGLSSGQAAVVAPTAGVIGAGIPVLVNAWTTGLPTATQFLGFGLALLGIGLVSGAGQAVERRSHSGLGLACLAGVCFGGFFVFIGWVEVGKVITPLLISRSLTLLTGVVLLLVNHQPFPSVRRNPFALLAGVLDAGGNLFYILARQYTRLDVAAVLSSLYPVATVLLADLILKEKISGGQWVGVGSCLLAIGLISA